MKNTQSLVSNSTEETVALGEQFAASLPNQGVVLLQGELGSGKTHFVQGIANALGVTQRVQSPTFAIIHEYHGANKQIVHLDLYRLNSLAEAATLDLPSLASKPNTIICVEWPNQIPYTWPNVIATVQFEELSQSSRSLLVRFN